MRKVITIDDDDYDDHDQGDDHDDDEDQDSRFKMMIGDNW